LLIEPLDKPALVQLCNKAGIDEFFGLVIADFGLPVSDNLVDGIKSFGDR
jgi:hypothetical protein